MSDSNLTAADVRKMRDMLLASIPVDCPDHQPTGEYVREALGTIVIVTCPNCDFTAWVHPHTWERSQK